MILRRGGISAIALATLVLCATPRSEAGERSRKAPFVLRAHAVDFESGQHPRRRSRRPSFEGYETHTIELDVFRRRRAGLERLTEVKLYLPNGDLYGTLEVTPTEEDSVARRASPVGTARLRVSGTMITRYGLYGSWRADVCWEVGTEASCRRALRFEIR